MLRHNARVRHHEILEGGTVIDGDLYSRNGLVIRVVYYAGVSVLLEYTRATGPLTVHDASLLLTANASASATWEPGKDSTETNRFYRRSDGKALAHYTTDADGSLLIASENIGTDFYGGKLMDRPLTISQITWTCNSLEKRRSSAARRRGSATPSPRHWPARARTSSSTAAPPHA